MGLGSIAKTEKGKFKGPPMTKNKPISLLYACVVCARENRSHFRTHEHYAHIRYAYSRTHRHTQMHRMRVRVKLRTAGAGGKRRFENFPTSFSCSILSTCSSSHAPLNTFSSVPGSKSHPA